MSYKMLLVNPSSVFSSLYYYFPSFCSFMQGHTSVMAT